MTPERTIRVTHHDREITVENLRAAYAAGCLDDGELEERCGLAYAARTRGDLAGMVSDLPPVPTTVHSTDTVTLLGRCPGSTGRSLGRWCWLMLVAAGAWVIAVAAGGLVALPLIFLWLVVVRLCGRHLLR